MEKHLSFPIRAMFLLVAALVAAGCVTMGHSSTRSAFDKAHRHFESGNYDLAERELNTLISGTRGGLDSADQVRALRLRADCFRKLKRFTLARYDYESARRISQSQEYALEGSASITIECDIAIGDMSMHEGSYRIADRIFAGIIDENPNSEFKDSVLYRRYICALKLGKPDPEMFTRQISNMYGFSAPSLRREFLGKDKIVSSPVPKPERPSRIGPDAPVVIIPRAEWNASPTRLNVNPMSAIRRVTVHHTGEEWTAEDFRTPANKIRAFQRYHQDDRGWADLGYHFVIDRRGRIWEGRSLRYQGAHAGSSQLNKGNVGISVMGNYENQTLAAVQKDSLAALLSSLCHEYDLKPWQISTHKELKTTACPGAHIQRYVDRLKATALR